MNIPVSIFLCNSKSCYILTNSSFLNWSLLNSPVSTMSIHNNWCDKRKALNKANKTNRIKHKIEDYVRLSRTIWIWHRSILNPASPLKLPNHQYLCIFLNCCVTNLNWINLLLVKPKGFPFGLCGQRRWSLQLICVISLLKSKKYSQTKKSLQSIRSVFVSPVLFGLF